MADDAAVRALLGRLLEWEDAHAGLESAIANMPEAHRGVVPSGLPYSAWQLLEHIRIAQEDILDFCRNPAYAHKKWPDDYWPAAAAPRSPAEWDESLRRYRDDRRALQQLAQDPAIDLMARIPHGEGQTYLRELLLVADHTAYHVGQIVLVRRLLRDWAA